MKLVGWWRCVFGILFRQAERGSEKRKGASRRSLQRVRAASFTYRLQVNGGGAGRGGRQER